MSFTTAVSSAVQAGTRVFPYGGQEDAAASFAREKGARLAVARHAVTAVVPRSLSPGHLRAAPVVPRLVLPSANGAAVAAAAPADLSVVAACLRNLTAVGSRLTAQGYGTAHRSVAVIAAGEQWPDGTLRPALEDLLGDALSSPTCPPRERAHCPWRLPPPRHAAHAPLT
ncbi:hypothetical protein OG235_03185 [Streptomyces sp. NBC_00024]|uniref:hypothetical protein n=1 Tax=Streptomyces sp. NBC_00024 TaxID=2903612 RepID=UPI003251C983